MKQHTLIVGIGLAMLMSACATATRGGTTLFIVETTPVGAHVTTTQPVKGSKKVKLSTSQIEEIKQGTVPAPDFSYRFCEPTPCGIEMPRKSEFDILITKEGYRPQTHTIGHKHRKEIAKETRRNTALAAGVSGAAGGAMFGAVASSIGAAGATGVAIGGAALFAAPALVFGVASLSVDASTGANYDLLPNPLLTSLLAIEETLEEKQKNQEIIDNFDKSRRASHLIIKEIKPRTTETYYQLVARKKRERKEKLEQEKAISDNLLR